MYAYISFEDFEKGPRLDLWTIVPRFGLTYNHPSSVNDIFPALYIYVGKLKTLAWILIFVEYKILNPEFITTVQFSISIDITFGLGIRCMFYLSVDLPQFHHSKLIKHRTVNKFHYCPKLRFIAQYVVSRLNFPFCLQYWILIMLSVVPVYNEIKKKI